MAASDFVAEFEQAFRKRVRIGTVAWVVAAVTLFGVLGFGYLVSPGRPTWFLAVVVGDPLITGIAIVPIRKRLARIAKLPRALRERAWLLPLAIVSALQNIRIVSEHLDLGPGRYHDTWQIVLMTPGRHPLAELHFQLTRSLPAGTAPSCA